MNKLAKVVTYTAVGAATVFGTVVAGRKAADGIAYLTGYDKTINADRAANELVQRDQKIAGDIFTYNRFTQVKDSIDNAHLFSPAKKALAWDKIVKSLKR